MKFLLSFFVCLNLLFAVDIKEPYKVIEADSNVISSALIEGILYLGTDSGRVDMYDISKDLFLEPIVLPKIALVASPPTGPAGSCPGRIRSTDRRPNLGP